MKKLLAVCVGIGLIVGVAWAGSLAPIPDDRFNRTVSVMYGKLPDGSYVPIVINSDGTLAIQVTGSTTTGLYVTTSSGNAASSMTSATVTITAVVAIPTTALSGRSGIYLQTSSDNTAPIWYCPNSNCVANATGANILLPGQPVVLPAGSSQPIYITTTTAGQTITATEWK